MASHLLLSFCIRRFTDVKDDLNQKLTDKQYRLLVAESVRETIREEANRFLQERYTNVLKLMSLKKHPQGGAWACRTEVLVEPVIKIKTVGKIDLDAPKVEKPAEPLLRTG